MKKKNRKGLIVGIGLLVAFVLWTVAVKFIDVQPIGPEGSVVGFATVNRFVHGLTGVNMSLYNITDLLGLVPLGFVMVFGVLGLIQWVKRKHILKVDYSILVLGGFYIVVMAVYVLFEMLTLNYRPVLINGILEASYPSSTTMLVMCVMPTALMQLNTRINNRSGRYIVCALIIIFTAFMVISRLVSGVHWLSDIIGGALLSIGLVLLYYYFSMCKVK